MTPRRRFATGTSRARKGSRLVNKFDGEVPQRYFQEVMEYIEMKPERFGRTLRQSPLPHLWKRVGDSWQLRHRLS